MLARSHPIDHVDGSRGDECRALNANSPASRTASVPDGAWSHAQKLKLEGISGVNMLQVRPAVASSKTLQTEDEVQNHKSDALVPAESLIGCSAQSPCARRSPF